MLRPELPTWLVGTMSYAIAPGLDLVGNELVDSDGMRFPLNDTARILCEIGREPADVDTVVEMVAQWTAAPRDQVRSDVQQFVVEMAAQGLISVHQSHLREAFEVVRALPLLLSAMIIDRRIAYKGRFPLRRYRATAHIVTVGVVEAHQGLTWIGLVLAAVMAVLLGTHPITSLNLLQTTTVVQVVCAMLAFFLALIGTIAAHEWCHYLAARRTGSDAYAFYVRAGACGLSFRAPSSRAQARVIVAGPLGGAAAALLLVAVVLVVPAEVWVWLGLDQLRLSLSGALALVAGYHLMALTPIQKDGRQLFGLRQAHRLEGAH